MGNYNVYSNPPLLCANLPVTLTTGHGHCNWYQSVKSDMVMTMQFERYHINSIRESANIKRQKMCSLPYLTVCLGALSV